MHPQQRSQFLIQGRLRPHPPAVAKRDREPPHPVLLAPGLYGPHHQHFFCVRLDMEVDGERNSVVEGRLFVCTYTMRDATYRLISVRKASRKEQRTWLP